MELPEEITSWILSILAKGTQTEALRKEHETHKRKRSTNGPTSPLDAELTYTCGDVQQRKRMRSLVDSRSVSEIENLATKLQFNLKDKQFQPPSVMWQRPLDRKVMPTPEGMKEARLV